MAVIREQGACVRVAACRGYMIDSGILGCAGSTMLDLIAGATSPVRLGGACLTGAAFAVPAGVAKFRQGGGR